jgi:hypothetical protein
MAIAIQRQGVSLLLIVVAIILFVVSALGVGDKLGFNLVDLGLACFAAAFIF